MVGQGLKCTFYSLLGFSTHKNVKSYPTMTKERLAIQDPYIDYEGPDVQYYAIDGSSGLWNHNPWP